MKTSSAIHTAINSLIALSIALVGGFYADELPGPVWWVLLIACAVLLAREVWMEMRGKVWRVVTRGSK